ncbi:MAG TPA: hypothetical protein VLG09_02205 [Candidatus Saccharimonadales bacterium]|nr:hypothetical protein [Candidatus Saccharimonadales bacterium]
MSVEQESASISDSLQLDTWNRERTIEELRNFVNVRHDALAHIDVE